MHDPNREKDRGDPNVDELGDETLFHEQVAPGAARRDSPTSADEARRLRGDAAWSGSNPGTTGDAAPASGGTAEAGSGAHHAEDDAADASSGS